MMMKLMRSLRSIIWMFGFAALVDPGCGKAEPNDAVYQVGSVLGTGKRRLLPGGAALCVALGLKPDATCTDDAILEGSESSTDRTLWIDKLAFQRRKDGAPDCLKPVAVVSYDKDTVVYACHTPDEDDTVTEDDLRRLQAIVTRLNNDPHKTFAKHQWILSFKELLEQAKP